VETLSRSLPSHDSGSGSAREYVIRHALDILFKIHTALAVPVRSHSSDQIENETQETLVEDARRRRALHTLLDLISLEGLYPSLSQGVGIPLEKRVISILPLGVVAKNTPLSAHRKIEQEELLQNILTILIDIIFDDRPGLQPIVRGRILIEIVCGVAELAFNSHNLKPEEKSKYQSIFQRILEEYV
jgi:hypothetical protein